MKPTPAMRGLLAAVLVLAPLAAARSQDSGAPTAAPDAAVAAPPTDVWSDLQNALFKGQFNVNLRLRAEIVEQDDTDTSQAYTERFRMGYGTNPFYGFSGYIEFEDTRAADYDLYNAAGLNGQPDKAVVADPQDTELNQFFAKYVNEFVTAIAGRQRITLDDHRFVGNVGWRQLEQTYDAYTLSSNWFPETTLLYSYIDDVNRVFGPDARRDFKSDSHLVNASYSGLPVGKITGFAYLLDFSNAEASTSNTVGLRFEGKQSLPQDFAVGYVGSYAYQVDGKDNPFDYEAHYFLVEGSVTKKDLGNAGVGYEVLTSDNGEIAFATPLATLHAMNGWADLFLTTPADGLEDLYVFAGTTLPYDVGVKAIFHWFSSEDDSADHGNEIDAVASKKLTDNVNVLAKLAVFTGKSDLPDTQKYWLQTEIKF